MTDAHQVGNLTEVPTADAFWFVRDNFPVLGFLLTSPSWALVRFSTTEQGTRWFFVMCWTIKTPRGTSSEHCVHCCISTPCTDLKCWWNDNQLSRFFEHSEQLHITNTTQHAAIGQLLFTSDAEQFKAPANKTQLFVPSPSSSTHITRTGYYYYYYLVVQWLGRRTRD